ncbi:MAG: RsmE family RNA methyltransferase [Acidimicrobiales bacterium]
MADLDEPVLDADDAHHLQRVMRLRDGEELTVSDGAGRWRRCRCRFVGGGRAARLEAVGPVRTAARPSPEIAVALAPAKGERMSWATQKLTELGVDVIVPMATARSVVRWEGDRATAHVERLRKVAREAAMQSRRAWLPLVEEMVAFDDVASRPGAVLAAPGGGPPSLARPLVLVGPEGGWEDAELGRGLPRLGLGPLVLRTETAAVAASAVLAALRAGTVRPADAS